MHFGYSNKSKQKEKCYKINLPRKEIENLESSRKKAKNSKTIFFKELLFSWEPVFGMINGCHNGFPLDLDDHKNKRESPPIFSVRVWSVTRVLKLGTEILNLKQHNWSTKLIWEF